MPVNRRPHAPAVRPRDLHPAAEHHPHPVRRHLPVAHHTQQAQRRHHHLARPAVARMTVAHPQDQRDAADDPVGVARHVDGAEQAVVAQHGGGQLGILAERQVGGQVLEIGRRDGDIEQVGDGAPAPGVAAADLAHNVRLRPRLPLVGFRAAQDAGADQRRQPCTLAGCELRKLLRQTLFGRARRQLGQRQPGVGRRVATTGVQRRAHPLVNRPPHRPARRRRGPGNRLAEHRLEQDVEDDHCRAQRGAGGAHQRDIRAAHDPLAAAVTAQMPQGRRVNADQAGLPGDQRAPLARRPGLRGIRRVGAELGDPAQQTGVDPVPPRRRRIQQDRLEPAQQGSGGKRQQQGPGNQSERIPIRRRPRPGVHLSGSGRL
ncbi:MAG: hypothetical protein BWZ02_02587 [Lentisphaerae bacterium ADurb.BinA184]|nr:MAG: hypothetical protein BWZ02_02587 [Lentisphaerae bacterium ADurb.BinA184]